jgi:hypothetical protein
MLGIGCNGLERFSCSPEQQAVHLSLVLKSQRCEWLGQSEDNMKILARQQLSPAPFQPLGSRHSLAFWAMAVAAGVVRVPFMPAMVTTF